MSAARNAYEVQLPNGPLVVLAELSCTELLMAMRSAGSEPSASAQGFAVSREALRLSIRQVDGVVVKSYELEGTGWAQRFPRTRQFFQLADAWTQIHLPTEDGYDAAINGAAVEDDGTAERWTVHLPADRVVVMAETDPDTVRDVMRQARESSRAPSAADLSTMIEGCRRSVREIDGSSVSLDDLSGRKWDAYFSVRETFLLGRAWQQIHTGGGQAKVGELKPVSGA